MSTYTYHPGDNGRPAICRAKLQCPKEGMFHGSKEKVQEYINEVGKTQIVYNIYDNQISTAEDKHSEELDTVRTQRAKANADLQGGITAKYNSQTVLNDVSEPDGGATFSPSRGTSPQVGFCYSPYPKRSEKVTKITLAKQMEYFRKNKDLLEKEDHYIGVWNDPKTGIIYLDVSVHTMDAKKARKECKENDQIAYFDLQDYSSVTVDPNAKSGQE